MIATERSTEHTTVRIHTKRTKKDAMSSSEGLNGTSSSCPYQCDAFAMPEQGRFSQNQLL